MPYSNLQALPLTTGALAFHLCLNLSEKISQPAAHFLAQTCVMGPKIVFAENGPAGPKQVWAE